MGRRLLRTYPEPKRKHPRALGASDFVGRNSLPSFQRAGAIGTTLEALIAAFCRLAEFLRLVSADRSLPRAVGGDTHVTRNPAVTRAAENSRTNRIIGLICPLLPPRVFAKSRPIRKMVGRGGGDRIYQRYGNKGVLRCSLAF